MKRLLVDTTPGAHAIKTIHYLVHKELGAPRAKLLINMILRLFHVAALNGIVLEQALRLPLTDFEAP